MFWIKCKGPWNIAPRMIPTKLQLPQRHCLAGDSCYTPLVSSLFHSPASFNVLTATCLCHPLHVLLLGVLSGKTLLHTTSSTSSLPTLRHAPSLYRIFCCVGAPHASLSSSEAPLRHRVSPLGDFIRIFSLNAAPFFPSVKEVLSPRDIVSATNSRTACTAKLGYSVQRWERLPGIATIDSVGAYSSAMKRPL